MRASLALWFCVGVAGCQSVQFYGQAVSGHLDLMRDRVSVERLLDDPTADPALVQRLELSQGVLDFAADQVGLPVDGHYRSYVELRREHVVWNVFATEEFSVDPVIWCYPIIGCAAYRGYFAESAAEKAAQRLRLAARDARVDGVAAYSTLGWFDDPLLSTFIDWPAESLAGLLFHELAHGRLFAKGDTAFNESYASFVEREALEQWLRAGADAALLSAWQARRAMVERFARFMLNWRQAFEAFYAVPHADFARRLLKSELLDLARACYLAHRDALGAGHRDEEFEGDFNNADFVPWMAYREWVPAFSSLFRSVDSDWKRFHAAAEDLAHLDATSRREALEGLQERALAEQAGDGAKDAIQCHALTVYPASTQ